MFHLIAEPREIEILSAPERRIVCAVRIRAILIRRRQCPMRDVAGQLGSLRAAAHLHLMLEEVAAAWPEPFTVSPICCRRLSHDEALLADLLRAARHRDRPGFDKLSEEMLPQRDRETLFLSASVLHRVVGQAV